MIEWLWNFRDAHAAPNKTQILVKHVSSSAVVEPPAPKNKKNTSTLLHWGVLSQQPMNTHTHTLFQFVLKKYCPCNFKTNLRDAVTATHKCTHTHTLFQFVFNKCCYGNFKTNLRDAVTATHKCTHTHTLFQFVFNKSNAVTATLKQIWGMLSQQPINAHTHTQTLRGDSHLTPSYNTQATLLSQHICNANSRLKVNFKENKFCANSHLIPSFPTEHE